jgi:hypothetical protein
MDMELDAVNDMVRWSSAPSSKKLLVGRAAEVRGQENN